MSKTQKSSLLKRLQVFLRFNTHLSIFIVVMGILWIVQWSERDTWGPEWLIAISLLWGLILLIHFISSWWRLRTKRGADRN